MKQRTVGFVRQIPKEMVLRLKNNQCPICGLNKNDWKRRKDWTCCSKECSKKYGRYFYSWQTFKVRAFQRNKAKCQKCGWQAPIKKNEGYSGDDEWIKDIYNNFFVVNKFYHNKEFGRNQLCAEVYDTSELIADHIKPIALGGAEFDLSNIQTLCIACNKIKTKGDMKKIAEARSIEKKLIINKQLK
jgi:5-methylcytosine-specific restriction endonuclease McrA